MKQRLACIIILASTVVTAGAAAVRAEAPRRFEGHRVARVTVTGPEDVELLRALDDADRDFDVEWHGIQSGRVWVRVSPVQWPVLQGSGLSFELEIADLQQMFDEAAQVAAEEGGPAAAAGIDTFFLNFRDYDAHTAYLQDLAAAHPDLAEVFSMGTSLEGRPLWVIKIAGAGEGPKPAVLYHGGEHAREWITPPVVAYLAQHLLRRYDEDTSVRGLVDGLDWYLMPIMNPDGYVYSWDFDRFWRKNRRDNGDGNFGVDLNRNWGYGWGGQGSSGQTWSNTYRGPAPFSEPETQIVRDFLEAHPNMVAHLDIHSYGGQCLWPYGTTATPAPDHAIFKFVGERMRDEITAVNGHEYETGAIHTTLYPASGVSVDWTYEERGLWSYTFEMRGTGFAPLPNEIIPLCEELLPAMTTLAEWSWDCNGNGTADSQDILLGSAADCNGNWVIDNCEPIAACMPPRAVPVGARYLAATPPPIAEPLAIRLTSPEQPCLVRYAGADGSLVETPVYLPSSNWGDVLLHGPALLPDTTYEITVLPETDEPRSTLVATNVLGDANGDGVANFDDVLRTVMGFLGESPDPAATTDFGPCAPDGVVTLEDVLLAVMGFQSRGGGALDCPPACR